ncbi:hypothetical protein V6N13_031795 [Hibiscus sabdariffa]|uniref:Uncharacterized protein n=2 Tax=Hibiscus sabdariffa TaxID=183260 RepID=A0ABR2AGB2_9ROSI
MRTDVEPEGRRSVRSKLVAWILMTFWRLAKSCTVDGHGSWSPMLVVGGAFTGVDFQIGKSKSNNLTLSKRLCLYLPPPRILPLLFIYNWPLHAKNLL